MQNIDIVDILHHLVKRQGQQSYCFKFSFYPNVHFFFGYLYKVAGPQGGAKLLK